MGNELAVRLHIYQPTNAGKSLEQCEADFIALLDRFIEENDLAYQIYESRLQEKEY